MANAVLSPSVPRWWRVVRIVVGVTIALAILVTFAGVGWKVWEGSERERLNQESLAAAGASAPTQAAPIDSGWPKLFGPHGTSVSTETEIEAHFPPEGPPVAWERPVGTGYSSPVVTDAGLVLFHRQKAEERLECLDPETGDVRWAVGTPTSYSNRYEYSDGPYSTPVIDGDRVLALSAEGVLRCREMRSGDLIWERDLRKDYDVPQGLFPFGHTPCVDGPRIIVNAGGLKKKAGVVALDRETGQTLWTATDHGASYATPVVATIHDERHALVFTAKGLVSLEPETGRERWSIDWGVQESEDRVNAVTPLVYGDLVLLSAGPGPGNLCLRILPDGTAVKVWEHHRSLDSQFNNQICLDGYVYGYTSIRNRSAAFVCLDLLTGKVRWEWESDLSRGSGLAVQDRLILFGEHGQLASLEVNPDAPVVLSRTEKPLLAKPCYSMPGLHRGRLYLRNEKRVLCLDLRRAPANRN
jgi:outer membrane protein assembly factor BamB